jgi:hypothetical protein
MNKTIEINMDSFFAKEATRKARKEILTKLANPQSVKANAILGIIADIITDASEGYTFKDGHDDIMITDAVKKIIELVEVQN